MKELNIHQEREAFIKYKRSQLSEVDPMHPANLGNDKDLFSYFYDQFIGWCNAKVAVMENASPKCWLRTRKSNGEVDTDFEGPTKHIDLFDWVPLFAGAVDPDVRDAKRYRIIRDRPMEECPMARPVYEPEYPLTFSPAGLDQECDKFIAILEKDSSKTAS